ncbi:MAG: hypothetical protein JSW71_20385 [Gemmatimonadota bacterium]|nr:MAG: hypothetical protein JSW71_20385 [Gemmatimonadota bacterium]
MTEILPSGSATEADMAQLRLDVAQYKAVKQVIKKQRVNGTWSGNILGTAPAKAQGITDVGTVAQYRRLLELGASPEERPLRIANSLLFRILSRDKDPALLFEYQKASKANQQLGEWARDLMREGVTAALAQARKNEDPRVRGSAHRIVTQVSQFLRSDLAEKPIIRKGSRNILHPDARPPTVFAVTMLAFMPRLQRERAGFVERLGAYLTKPTTKRAYTIQLGRKSVKPTFHLMGEPLAADSAGNPKDLPLALHWLEILARLQLLEQSPVAVRILTRLLRDCDDQGVWNPKNLRALPRSPTGLADFAFPLEADTRSPDAKKSDVTFRLALIAKLAGWTLRYS